jgi:hypothetical protein
MDNSDVNIINYINVVSLSVIMVWFINDTPDSLMADTTVSASGILFHDFKLSPCSECCMLSSGLFSGV